MVVMSQRTGIERAVEKAGSQTVLAAELGVSQQVVSRWMRRGWVPSSRVPEIAKRFGVPRASLIEPRLRALLG
jgi:DNA-binding transcriptional regulator YdaS (Cro superfamily)